jgi:hypothetical protein
MLQVSFQISNMNFGRRKYWLINSAGNERSVVALAAKRMFDDCRPQARIDPVRKSGMAFNG